jgi:hypothetical protein
MSTEINNEEEYYSKILELLIDIVGMDVTESQKTILEELSKSNTADNMALLEKLLENED